MAENNKKGEIIPDYQVASEERRQWILLLKDLQLSEGRPMLMEEENSCVDGMVDSIKRRLRQPY